ncbi:hypothetical protein [Nocardioides pelophilus]|uniref:hypothetical protein n=1 Tax=Nocardioides pelophilus TaxID=2172019 RepID=UPI0016049C0A|nr:hypothetical protein [Nocardioides pelophilus]
MAVSFYEWRNPRISFDVRLERLADLPVNFFANRRMLTVSAKRRLYDQGRFGVATVLRAPRRVGGAAVGGEGIGRFKVRIESVWWRTYDVWVTQSFSLVEWGLLQTGALVECRVDPHKPWRVLICAPEPQAG